MLMVILCKLTYHLESIAILTNYNNKLYIDSIETPLSQRITRNLLQHDDASFVKVLASSTGPTRENDIRSEKLKKIINCDLFKTMRLLTSQSVLDAVEAN